MSDSPDLGPVPADDLLTSEQRHAFSAPDRPDEVRIDPLHHFWGVSGPPKDLATGDALPDSPLD